MIDRCQVDKDKLIKKPCEGMRVLWGVGAVTPGAKGYYFQATAGSLQLDLAYCPKCGANLQKATRRKKTSRSKKSADFQPTFIDNRWL